MRVLVAFYSRTRITERVANDVADVLDASLETIAEPSSRRGVRGYLRSLVDVALTRSPILEPFAHDVAKFDLVVVGTPTWDAQVASPVRTYLQDVRGSLPAIALFATCTRRGGDRAVAQMEDIARKAALATMVLRQADVEDGASRFAIGRFVEAIRSHASGTAAAAPLEAHA